MTTVFRKTYLIFFLLFFLPTPEIFARGVCVSRSKVNLRAKPSSRATITWVVGRHTPLIFLKQKGNWFHVQDQDGEKHWVYGTGVTTDYQCTAVNYKYVLLRKGPNARSGLAPFHLADRYTPFRRIERQEDWQKVQDQFGAQYWVRYDALWFPRTMMKVDF